MQAGGYIAGSASTQTPAHYGAAGHGHGQPMAGAQQPGAQMPLTGVGFHEPMIRGNSLATYVIVDA
jgi:hypothetical protein